MQPVNYYSQLDSSFMYDPRLFPQFYVCKGTQIPLTFCYNYYTAQTSIAYSLNASRTNELCGEVGGERQPPSGRQSGISCSCAGIAKSGKLPLPSLAEPRLLGREEGVSPRG